MKFRHIMLAACYALALASCSSNKTSLTYFEDIKTISEGAIDVESYKIKIVPDDELIITVTSENPAASVQYNLPLVNPAVRESLGATTTPQAQTYIVNKEGDINFPILGMLHVEGMTTLELQNMLTERIGQDVQDPQVRVALLNFKINVMGEVRAPGRYTVRTERVSLLDALAMAGDMTEFGERENVTLIREEKDGKLSYHHFNLNNSEFLKSPYFYLQQNDVVYVEPNTIKKDNSKYNQNNSYKLSVISTIVGTASVIASLVIAFAVK